jgi:hypothetical protein
VNRRTDGTKFGGNTNRDKRCKSVGCNLGLRLGRELCSEANLLVVT